MEAATLDLMYQIPSDESIANCVITKEIVEEALAVEGQSNKKIEAK
jgi:ATP-dependent Clp protease ATP-binding subunit ClpX